MNLDRVGPRRQLFFAAVLGVVFGLQCLRAFFPSMVYILKDRLGVPSVGLALFGIGAFALAGLFPKWIRGQQPNRSVTVLVGFLAGVRALLQLWPGDPIGFLVLSLGGSLVLLALLAALPPRGAARIFLCGACIDLALHAFCKTEDLHWASGWKDGALVFLAAAALLLAFRANREAAQEITQEFLPEEEASRGKFVWGPFLFLHLEVLGNVARFSARTDSSSELAGAALAASHAIALALLARGASANWRWRAAAAAGALASFVFAGAPGGVAFVQIPMAILSCAILLESAILRTGKAGSAPSGAWFALGSVLLILLTFAHYAAYDLQFPWTRIHVWVAAAAMLVLSALRRGERVTPHRASPALPAIPCALCVLLMIAAVRDRRDARAATQLLPDPLRIITFNLHAGFDEQGTFAFASMMEKLRAEDADVIALQEVSRGWIINGSADLFELARSALPHAGVFRATVGRDWGNSVFSKAPVLRVEELTLPPPKLALSRAVLVADVRAQTPYPLRVLATHFHHRTIDDAIRIQEAHAVATHFPSGVPTVLLGDFNATPASKTFDILQSAGWREALPPGDSFTYPSRSPVRRIDTIFVRGPVEVVDARILSPWGSDHRGVVAELKLIQ